MKILGYLLLVTVCLGCGPQTQSTQKSSNPPQFDWLLGHWQRSNESGAKQTYEQWHKQSPTQYQGLGFTMEGMDTVFKEDILLIQREEKWYFEVSGVNENTTVFVLTESDSLSFSCENPANEFPKLIKYYFAPPYLKALISDGETTIPFDFEQISDD